MDPLVFLLLASGISAACASPSDGYYRFPPPPSPAILYIASPPPPPPPARPPPPPPPRTLACDPSSDCGDVVQLVPRVNPSFCLTSSNDGTGTVFMAQCSKTNEYQFWIKDDSWGRGFADATGFKAFALVNLANNMALRHGIYENQRVDAAEIGEIQGGFLWTMSQPTSDNYRTIRSCENINLNLDVDHGDRKRGGVKDRNPLIIFEWKKGDNQLWAMLKNGNSF